MSIRVTGVGTLTRDAEMNKTAKGAWVKFGLATKRKNVPEGIQDVDFFEANYFLKNPESTLMNYLKKGTSIYLDNAEMRADMYEKDGQKRTMNKVMIFSFDLLSTNASRKADREEANKPAPEKPAPLGPPEKKEPPVDTPTVAKEEDNYPDEIPF
jgi:single-stranded DNA-binding protein